MLFFTRNKEIVKAINTAANKMEKVGLWKSGGHNPYGTCVVLAFSDSGIELSLRKQSCEKIMKYLGLKTQNDLFDWSDREESTTASVVSMMRTVAKQVAKGKI